MSMHVIDTQTEETSAASSQEVESKDPKSENVKDTWVEFVTENFSQVTGFWGKVRAALKIMKFMILYG